MSILPRAVRPFVTFPALLRANGFAVAPEQTTAFLAAIGLLGPKSVADIRRAAHATLAPPPERRAAFDALFGAHFLGELEEGEALGEPDDETVRVQEEREGGAEPLLSDEVNEAGQDATTRRGAVGAAVRRRERFRGAAPLRARRARRTCRGAPATGGCGRGAATISTRAAPCARRCATTAT